MSFSSTRAIASHVFPCARGTGSPRTTRCRPRRGLPQGSVLGPPRACRVVALLLAETMVCVDFNLFFIWG